MERLGIVDELQANTAALIESARKRGMSASAIARLPKPARVAKPVELPPVVLAAASEGNPVSQASMIAYRAKFERRRKAAKRFKGMDTVVVGRPEITPADRALYRQIVDMASAAGGVSADEVADFIRPRRVVPVRHICWRLMREFSGLSAPAIARLTGRRCHNSITSGIRRCVTVNMQSPQWAAVYWEVRTRLSAAGHRMLEDLGKVKRGSRP